MALVSNPMKWKNFFNSRDYKNLYNLYSNDTVLIPTFSNKTIYGKKNLKSYFENIDKDIKVDLTSVNQKKGCDINILYGTYIFYNHKVFHKANYSFYYKFDTLENRYLIEYHHSSLVPGFKN